MGKVYKRVFQDAEKKRDSIIRQQEKNIADLYKKWGGEVGRRADSYGMKETASAAVKEQQLRELQRMLQEQSRQIVREVESGIKSSIYLTADAVVRSNNKWLASVGIGNTLILSGAFSHVPNITVQRLVTGKLYQRGWNLSERIWGDRQETMSQVYEIVAGGLAQNQSVYTIAKQLEQYITPGAAKPWNLRNAQGRMIYPRSVDYNAQRLVRTLTQHSYQESFDAVTRNNPLIESIRWNANGSRVCELCLSRHGTIYPKGEQPLDHPNGMCVMEPMMVDNIVGKIADWLSAPDGTYKDMDAFVRQMRNKK